MTQASSHRVAISIGGVSVGVRTHDGSFAGMLHERYASFAAHGSGRCDYEFDVELHAPDSSPDEDVRVFRDGEAWRLERGDFRAHWNPTTRTGRVRQSPNPYSIDTVLRIVHTLVLAREGGFLMHAASAICDGKAYIFAGASGAGKTTLARLAPGDVHLLSDEISYVRREAGGYFAYGTPFAGELGRPGENMRAPLTAVYLLSQARENRIVALDAAQAARGLLANTLFFAEDVELVQAVFHAALDLAQALPVSRLEFVKHESVWDCIREPREEAVA